VNIFSLVLQGFILWLKALAQTDASRGTSENSDCKLKGFGSFPRQLYMKITTGTDQALFYKKGYMQNILPERVHLN
jgi:hypothetical protein